MLVTGDADSRLYCADGQEHRAGPRAGAEGERDLGGRALVRWIDAQADRGRGTTPSRGVVRDVDDPEDRVRGFARRENDPAWCVAAVPLGRRAELPASHRRHAREAEEPAAAPRDVRELERVVRGARGSAALAEAEPHLE